MAKGFDPSAIASDISRSRKQYLARKLATLLIGAFGLNRAGFFATEFVQAITPIVKVPTQHGPFFCRCGHGRLLWRAKTFHTEEPETIAWLDALQPEDVLWDIGANVGMYSVYAAKFKGCHVYAFEPESQNFALLVENIALNQIRDRCFPACLAITDRQGIGRMGLRYVTKGGAYNLFQSGNHQPADDDPRLPESIHGEQHVVEQINFGTSVNDLISQHGFTPPTHLKIDVDGIEPEIIDGASKLLESGSLRSILIELNRNSAQHMQVPEKLAEHGFRLVSERSNWLLRTDRSREHEYPSTNMIFFKE